MKKRALHKDFFMEIKKSFHRYASILLIVALGVAFFSGVRASKPDMVLSADIFYDESNLMDIRVVSTLGLTDEDVEAIRQVEGAGDVMPVYSSDVLCESKDNLLVIKLMSLPDPVNQLKIEAGRLPQESGECLVDEKLIDSYGYQIGDQITVQSGNDTELSDIVNTSEYTIVGYGSSPLYLSLERGSSSIGSGDMNGFVVIPKENFTLEAYTEICLTAAGAKELTCYTDEYDDFVDKLVSRIEDISETRCEARYEEVKKEGDDKIRDAEEEVADGEQKLADAKQKIEDGQQEINDAKQTLAEKEQELKDAKKELADKEQELEDGKEQLADGFRELEENQDKVAEGREKWQEGIGQASDGERELEEAKRKLTETEAQLKDAREQLNTQEQSLNAAQEQLKQMKEAYAPLKAAADAGYPLSPQQQAQLAQLEAGIAAMEPELQRGAQELETGKQQLEAGEQQLEAGRGQLAQQEALLEASKQQLSDSGWELEDAERQIGEAKALLYEKQEEIHDGDVKIADAKAELRDGEHKLEDARKELTDAEQKLTDGQQEYEEARAENEPKIADAKQDIEDAKEQLNDLEVPEWFVLDRQYLQTYVEYGQNSDRIGAIGDVFPAIFFLVAALVALTTMTRMVEEERTQIGTLKALGYGKAGIAGKYIWYALSASLFGSLLGLVVGQKLLPYVIINAYKILYNNLPAIVTPLNFNYSVTSTALAVFCTTIAVIAACYKELLAVPAQLMRPAAPKAGKRVMLERVTFLWKHLNFTGKATIRNLIRYKKRFLMTVLGIGGCTALLLVGFGLQDSIMSIGDLQFENVRVYNASIGIDEDADAPAQEALADKIKSDDRIKSYLPAREVAMDIGFGGAERSGYLVVPEYPDQLQDYIRLKDRITDTPYVLTDDTVIITEKVAALLGISKGDTIYLKDKETSRVEVAVGEIAENYFMHYVYMTPALYEKLYQEKPVYNEYLTIDQEKGEAFQKEMQEEYINMEACSGVSFVSDTENRIRDMLKSMDTIIYVLVISAGMLAFIVLYNLNNINITERKRELATLKVLGFFDGEVSAYMLRENILLTMIGALIGLFMGVALHRFVIITAEIDMLMFGRLIKPRSFVYSVLFTFAFSLFVNFTMHFKLKKIDMVESMKSVE